MRVDLAGGWTDVPPYSGRHGGAVVNAALELHVEVECRERQTGLRIASEDIGVEVEADSVDGLAYDGRLDLIKAALRRSELRTGWEVETRAQVPGGSGLGASGALGVALVTATRVAVGRPVEPREAAELAHLLEVEDLGVAGGKQDQYAAALGGFLALDFRDPDVAIARLSLDPSFVRALEDRSVLCYTGTSRVSGEMITRVMSGYESGEARIVAALDGLYEAAAAARDALTSQDIESLARGVQLNWQHQRALDPGMATPEMERIEAAAFAAGALGGKACGAGAGGCMYFIAGEGKTDAVGEALRSAGGRLLPVGFEARGVRCLTSV